MVSRGATRNQEWTFRVQEKGQKQREMRIIGGAAELGENVQCLSGQWLSLEVTTR